MLFESGKMSQITLRGEDRQKTNYFVDVKPPDTAVVALKDKPQCGRQWVAYAWSAAAFLFTPYFYPTNQD